MKTESRGTEYTFFPGCLAQLKLPQIERSVRWVLTRPGFDLREEPRFTCCPDPVVFRSASKEDWLKLAARNLTLDSELPIVTLCPGCASSLSEARHLLAQNSDMRRSVEKKLGRGDTGLNIPEVSHFLRLLTDDGVPERMARALSNRLEGLKVACHYGCHLVRPSAAVQFDDPEKPTSLDSLVSLLGGEPVDYADKFMCCGRPLMDEATAAGIAEHRLSGMQDAGCDLMVVACPFCFEQFDLGQITLARKTGRKFCIPVVYITQLIGIGMGQAPEEMGLDLHRIKVKVLH